MVDYVALIPVAAIIFGAGALYQKFRGLMDNQKSIEKDIKSINEQLNNIGESKSIHDRLIKSQQAAFSVYIEAFISLIAAIQKVNPSISNDLIKLQSKLTLDATNKTLQAIAGGTGNPISKEEANRLKNYVERGRKNEYFTPDEAKDFYELSEILSRDRSDDEGAWGILLLAAAIAAFYYLSKQSNEND